MKNIAIIGAGHAGFEAAMACAALGHRTLVFALNLDSVGNMPCNPSIGGVAKGQIVREIDALGGWMGRAADVCCIQFRMLNRGKGPAVRSPRAQADRRAYSAFVRRTMEDHPNIRLYQTEIAAIDIENGKVTGVVDVLGSRYPAGAVILATGTYLRGRVITGHTAREGGPDGLMAANALDLGTLGLQMRRFKTGTPPRVHADSLDISRMELQEGENDVPAFSFDTDERPQSVSVCYLTWTNERTHEILRDNLHRSPLYDGTISGTGPRYCPSIEDKVVRFADKDRHPVFVEPMGMDTKEMYLQGFSSSMPVDVQLAAIRTVRGLENAEITRPAYAIEYDCIDPTCLTLSLMARGVEGLFAAGQLCGSSGYEEAAGQGLVAGVNASRLLQGKPPMIMPRSGSYIGTLIDDLVTRGTNEPYRMMTSRSEYRLLLRHDNADARLTQLGYEMGLVSKEKLERTARKLEMVGSEIKRLEKARLSELLRRPEVTYESLAERDPERPELPCEVCEQVEIHIKYEGYIRRQMAMLNSVMRMENRELPNDIDYKKITGLSNEAVQKLNDMRPLTLGQAGRISGVSPADITALMVGLGTLK